MRSDSASSMPSAPPSPGAAPGGGLQIRGSAKRRAELEEVPSAAPTSEPAPAPAPASPVPPAGSDGAALPTFLRPPVRASDQDAEWGLGTETRADVDPALAAKLARFHELKAAGTHIHTSLAKSRAFHNPHMYAKLVEYAGLDEWGSQYVAMAEARHEPPSWDVHDAQVRKDGSARGLGMWAASHSRRPEKVLGSTREGHCRRWALADRVFQGADEIAHVYGILYWNARSLALVAGLVLGRLRGVSAHGAGVSEKRLPNAGAGGTAGVGGAADAWAGAETTRPPSGRRGAGAGRALGDADGARGGVRPTCRARGPVNWKR